MAKKNLKNSIYDDGSLAYLVDGAVFDGYMGIPMLMDIPCDEPPKSLIVHNKVTKLSDKRQFIHFFEHDRRIFPILGKLSKLARLWQKFDGVLTPDFSLLRGQSICLQATNTYYNRAVGFYLQKHHIRIIPTIRWSDEESFSFCFCGVPKNFPVAISTHGCVGNKEKKEIFKTGLYAILQTIEPCWVVVHGSMPPCIFAEFEPHVKFYRYPSQIESGHAKGGA